MLGTLRAIEFFTTIGCGAVILGLVVVAVIAFVRDHRTKRPRSPRTGFDVLAPKASEEDGADR
jgi:hypothetical protein